MSVFFTQQQWQRSQCGPGDLLTQWGAEISPDNVLPAYPRPQLVRPNHSWWNLNGLWQFQPGLPNQSPPFGQNLNGSILVPFPVESCLSGVGNHTYQWLWYRLVFTGPFSSATGSTVLLHFGAVDWQTTVWLNRVQLGTHTGGYDGFSFDVTSTYSTQSNELLVFVFDPSDEGFQPNGKQRISAITNPGGDTYTPSSGIWQTVWLELVPSTYVANLTLLTDTRTLTFTAAVVGPQASAANITAMVSSNGTPVLKFVAAPNEPLSVAIPDPHVWSPSDPFLYDLDVQLDAADGGGSSDAVQSYFGLRSISLGRVLHPGSPDTGPQLGTNRYGVSLFDAPFNLTAAEPELCWELCKNESQCVAWIYHPPSCSGGLSPAGTLPPQCWLKSSVEATVQDSCVVSGALATPQSTVVRPLVNGGFVRFVGWLDQSFWPDGLYTAPTDDALAFDLEALGMFGMNAVRLHQKINPERWYYHADRLGVLVLQDMVQKYGNANESTVAPALVDMVAAVQGRYNHPCIVQYEIFNEFDMVGVFKNVSDVVQMFYALDPSRLVDTNSGGPANSLHLADVNDLHTYPYPGDPLPSMTQYGMLGEFGGVGAFVAGHEWVPGACQTYLHVNSTSDEAQTYIGMVQTMISRSADISSAIYTQITDVERECDGFLNYDRTNKFSDSDTAAIAEANRQLIAAP